MSKAAAELFKDLPLRASGPRNLPDDDVPDTPVPVEEPVDPAEPDDDNLPEDPIEEQPTAAISKVDELEMLKQRAQLMGIRYSNNIGVNFLKAKIQAKLDGEDVTEPAPERAQAVPEPVASEKSARQQMYETEMRLVRLRITNLDPKKKDLPGEIFTVANRVLGAVKKFIPYGEATDNGYHVPYFIYRQLKEREFLNIKTRKDRQGRTIVETSMAREFALEELPQLTQKELTQLAAQQAAAAGMN